MKKLTPQEALQAIANGEKLEYRHLGFKRWSQLNPLDNLLSLESILNGGISFRLAQEMIIIGDVSFPKPESEPLEVGTEYWVAAPTYPYYSLTNSLIWVDANEDKQHLQRGLVHLTRDAAIQHAKALVKLSGGTVDEG